MQNHSLPFPVEALLKFIFSTSVNLEKWGVSLSKVLIDSWSISDSFHPFLYSYRDETLSSDEFLLARQNLLSAIVLWDDIYINTRSPSMVYAALKHFHKFLNTPPFIHDIERDYK